MSDATTETDTPRAKRNAPKTPSSGQLRAYADAAEKMMVPAGDELLIEARHVVGEWLRYQADLKSPSQRRRAPAKAAA